MRTIRCLAGSLWVEAVGLRPAFCIVVMQQPFDDLIMSGCDRLCQRSRQHHRRRAEVDRLEHVLHGGFCGRLILGWQTRGRLAVMCFGDIGFSEHRELHEIVGRMSSPK